METIAKIRRRHLVNGESISAIARSLNLSRNTVKKYMNAADEPRYLRQYQHKPQLGPFLAILDKWLEHDQLLPKPRRRTSRRLFEGLQNEGYHGAYDSIQRHVKIWKVSRDPSKLTQAFVPLSFAPGDVGQFDWSYEYVVLGGVSHTIKLAHFRLAYSRQMFVIAYPRETQEMVLDAHVKAFSFFGGVPRQMIYDNLKTVVQTVFAGKSRRFNGRFMTLANHYLFEPVACTPASGWEKGQVENQVGNIREWLFTPTPHFDDFSGLNAWLAQRCGELSSRRHPQRAETIAAAMRDERPALNPVSVPFNSYVEQPLRVSSTCLITIDRNRYSVPAAWAGKVISVRLSAEYVRAVADGLEIACHVRVFGRDQVFCDPWHYLPILETKPGALRHGTPFVNWTLPLSVENVRQALLTEPKGDRAFADILLGARDAGLEALDIACQLALEYGKPSAAVILNELRRLVEPPRAPSLDVPENLRLFTEPLADCTRYDSLLAVNHV
ncbi:IS21 family transposase [Acerihabitans sp. TG2]|uniref:IS21 family transposase n=1 Tax=Acerihabitans sp. TG2 TaxID=3096008 RepID=UPI002B23405F|nr:IS21 family transposase [Acerihabitans sp. TG2]MEA9393635.1 IS21 family transposase [Acerihabitans sp. TG2]